MKKRLTILLPALICLSALSLSAQKGGFYHSARFDVDEALAPFYHGVASGDPTSESVIIWTRVASDSMQANVRWQVATDTAMTNIVAQGWALTDGENDFTVKVDVQGLQAYTTYYYEFFNDNTYSLRGRTKTTPAGDADSLRFAVVSCSNFAFGYFHAYEKIAERNDIDAVIHLGDYIYEYANGEYGDVRELEPTNEILNISDYRMRHSYYKLDPQLRRLHQQYPVIATWDDHESANDAWYGGAENHNDGEGDWFERKSASIQAYHEWMPFRKPDVTDGPRIYRKLSYGDLMDLYMLDTRLYGRDQQDGINTSPDRTILGGAQYDWLTSSMQASGAQWQVLGNQVMMAPLEVFGNPVNADQWDGYPAERNNLHNFVLSNNIPNMVVLTGDIHTSWANDLPRSSYNPDTGENSAGVEFVTTSVTSPGLPLPGGEALILPFNPHIKYANLTERGYVILDVNKDRTQADWYYIGSVTDETTTESYGTGWYTDDGTRHIQAANGPSIAPAATSGTTPAPADPRPFSDPVSTSEANELAFIGTHPNPARDRVYLQFFNHQALDIRLAIHDTNGKLVHQEDLGERGVGLQKKTVDISRLPAGTYFLSLQTGAGHFYRKVLVKVK